LKAFKFLALTATDCHSALHMVASYPEKSGHEVFRKKVNSL